MKCGWLREGGPEEDGCHTLEDTCTQKRRLEDGREGGQGPTGTVEPWSSSSSSSSSSSNSSSSSSMRISCRVTKATNTQHRTCNVCESSTSTMVTRTRPDVTFYVHYLVVKCLIKMLL